MVSVSLFLVLGLSSQRAADVATLKFDGKFTGVSYRSQRWTVDVRLVPVRKSQVFELTSDGLKYKGKPAYGTDGDRPHEQIGRFKVTFRGKQILIKRSLYENCFDLTLSDGAVSIVERYPCIDICMWIGDTSSYRTRWLIYPDGNVRHWVNRRRA